MSELARFKAAMKQAKRQWQEDAARDHRRIAAMETLIQLLRSRNRELEEQSRERK